MLRKIKDRWLACACNANTPAWQKLLLLPPIYGVPSLHFLYCLKKGELGNARNILLHHPFTAKMNRLYRRRLDEMLQFSSSGFPVKPSTAVRAPYNGRVLFALHVSLPHDRNGYALRSQAVLQALRDAGVEAGAVTRPGYPLDQPRLRGKSMALEETELVGGVTYTRALSCEPSMTGPPSEYINHYAALLMQTAQCRGASILHAGSNFMDGLSACMAAGKAGLSSIYEMRGLWHETRAFHDPGYHRTEEYRYCARMELTAARHADAVVTLSKAMRAYLVEQGLDTEKVVVVPNGVDAARFAPRPQDAALKAKLGLEEGVVVAGFFGSLEEYEGLHLAIDAVENISARGVPIALLIIGTGQAESRLRAHALQSKAARRVIFTGHVPFAEIPRYCSCLDFFVLPRLEHRLTRLVPPIKILEPMCMGKAVIVSDLEPLLESVLPDRTGMVCRSGDRQSLEEAMHLLASNASLREALGIAGRSWVLDHRTWPRLCERYLDLYERLPRVPATQL